MSRALIDASGMAMQDTEPNWTGGANKPLPEVGGERLIAAVAMVLRDEINTIRVLPLLGLTARSVDDIVNAIKAKLI